MDSEQQRLQSLGFSGIFKESFEIIYKNFKIFSDIWLFILVPLSMVFLIVVPNCCFNLALVLIQLLYYFNRSPKDTKYAGASFAAYTIALFTVYLFLAALSTCAVVYATANIYRSKEGVSLKKIVGLLRKIWKRLIVTFLIVFAIVFAISVVAELLYYVIFAKLHVPAASLALNIILIVIYLFSMVYIGFLGQLACVVSVLEEFTGFKAMIKARALVKGKKTAAVFIFIVSSVVVSCLLAGVEIILYSEWVMAVRTGVTFVGIVLLAFVNLLGLVLPTVLYFVCKAYHRESVTIEDL